MSCSILYIVSAEVVQHMHMYVDTQESDVCCVEHVSCISTLIGQLFSKVFTNTTGTLLSHICPPFLMSSYSLKRSGELGGHKAELIIFL